MLIESIIIKNWNSYYTFYNSGYFTHRNKIKTNLFGEIVSVRVRVRVFLLKNGNGEKKYMNWPLKLLKCTCETHLIVFTYDTYLCIESAFAHKYIYIRCSHSDFWGRNSQKLPNFEFPIKFSKIWAKNLRFQCKFDDHLQQRLLSNHTFKTECWPFNVEHMNVTFNWIQSDWALTRTAFRSTIYGRFFWSLVSSEKCPIAVWALAHFFICYQWKNVFIWKYLNFKWMCSMCARSLTISLFGLITCKMYSN